MPPIQQDGATEHDTAGGDEFDPSNAFLQLWETPADAEKPSEKDEGAEKVKAEPKKKLAPKAKAEDEEAKDDAAEESDPKEVQDDKEADAEAEGEDEAAEGEDEGEPKEDVLEGDALNFKVRWKVEGEDREFAVKDLVRLAGQEASLTRKSQEVANNKKALDSAATTQAEALNKLLERARSRWEPYAKVDFLKAARELDDTQLEALRAEAQQRHDDVSFLEQELGALNKGITERSQKEHAAAAKKCIEVLADPTTGIEGWGEPLYKELVGFAVERGMDKELVAGLTDPSAYRILHDAMLYNRGKAKVTITKDKSGKKAAPKKIVKTSTAPATDAPTGKQRAQKKAMDRLRDTGTREDAAEAFMSLWTPEGDN